MTGTTENETGPVTATATATAIETEIGTETGTETGTVIGIVTETGTETEIGIGTEEHTGMCLVFKTASRDGDTQWSSRGDKRLLKKMVHSRLLLSLWKPGRSAVVRI